MAKHAFSNLPGSFQLSACPTDCADKPEKEAANATLATLHQTLGELQDRLYASRQGSILLILQGLDTAGKDGTIRRLFSSVSPQGLTTHAFKQPTPEELAHDFLRRAHLRTPARGIIGIFNRSYYEAAVSDLVEGMIDKAERDRRCAHIARFEELLAENGTVVIKCFLHISKAEQKERLLKRLQDPSKFWKLSEADISSRAHWDDYQHAWSDAIIRTATAAAPWQVIPADYKWYRDLAVAQLMVDALKRIDPQYPPATRAFKPEEIK
jgi:PPK2 family polyphosphate:nucleotide phosphotransferase